MAPAAAATRKVCVLSPRITRTVALSAPNSTVPRMDGRASPGARKATAKLESVPSGRRAPLYSRICVRGERTTCRPRMESAIRAAEGPTRQRPR